MTKQKPTKKSFSFFGFCRLLFLLDSLSLLQRQLRFFRCVCVFANESQKKKTTKRKRGKGRVGERLFFFATKARKKRDRESIEGARRNHRATSSRFFCFTFRRSLFFFYARNVRRSFLICSSLLFRSPEEPPGRMKRTEKKRHRSTS